MNKGIRSWPRPLNVIKIRAALKLDPSAPPAVGAPFPSTAIKSSYNISKVVYNAAGTYTIYFARPMPDANFVVAGCGRGAGAAVPVIFVDNADPGRNDQVRINAASSTTAALGNNFIVHLTIFA